MGTSDLLFGPIYLLIIYALAIRDRNSNYPKGHPLHEYYMRGLSLKLFGAIAAGMIYFFYYKYGDTVYYFQRTTWVHNMFQQSIKNGFRLIFVNMKDPPVDMLLLLQNMRAEDTASYMVVRISSIIGLFTFWNYTSISLAFAYISFKGIFALFETLTELYPELVKEMAIACLFIPSVFFWGSGLFKDTITLTGVCWMTRSSYLIFFKKKSILPNALIFLVAFYFTFTIKAYIAMCFVPSLMFWIFFSFGSNIKSSGMRFLAMPFIMVALGGVAYIFLKKVGGQSSAWSADQIQDRAKDMQWWHTKVRDLYGADGGGGSFYSIGDGSFSPRNILISFPQAVIVSLFRPFLWEARNPIMILSSIEGMVMLYFTFKYIIKNGVSKVFKYSKDYPVIFFCFFFSIIFAFAVGFTSFNFGALVRYKIPLMPFYVAGLFMVQYHANKDKNALELARTLK